MTVDELTDSFGRVESQVARERGDFVLFALVLRDDAPDRWDLVVSAPWVGDDKRQAVDYMVGQIKAMLGPEYLTYLSRIVFVDPDQDAVQNLNRAMHVEHGNVEVRDSYFFGLPIRRAAIITSKRPAAWSELRP
jgi:hypothetical protein